MFGVMFVFLQVDFMFALFLREHTVFALHII